MADLPIAETDVDSGLLTAHGAGVMNADAPDGIRW